MTDAIPPTNGQPAEATPTVEDNRPADVMDLEAKLDAAARQAQTNLEGWQRERAEFTNYKRRVERERADLRQNALADALAGVLPIVDDFERSLNNVPAALQGDPWLNGTALILNKLHKLLRDFGVETLDPVGQPFDPSRHEAISMEPHDTVASGHVIETLQKGYTQGDKVVRPALVRVAQ